MNRPNRYASPDFGANVDFLHRGTCLSRKYVVIMSGVLLLMLLIVGLALYKWMAFHVRQPLEVFFGCMIIYLLMDRCITQYTVCLDRQQLVITKRTLWGTIKKFPVSLDSIDELFRYKPDIVGLTRYRHTYRLHSALDKEAVWTLVYDVHRNGKAEKWRIFFKPGTPMVQALKKTLQHQVVW